MEDAPTLQWQSQEHFRGLKNTDWFWYVGFFALLLSVISLYLGNFTFAVVIILGAFVVVLEAGRPARKQKYSLSKKGLHVGDAVLPYKQMTSFSIHDTDHGPHLMLETNKAMHRHVIIPLGAISTREIRRMLTSYIPEEEHDLPLSERLAERLGL